MTTTLRVRNVHAALPAAIKLLTEHGLNEPSRNGPVLVYPYPLTTLYERPEERVLFWHERDANPFFHLMEALGFLAGRYDVEFFANYVKQMRAYSDDGVWLPASYGHRIRTYFDVDQFKWAIGRLRADYNDRRVVISMWDPVMDPVMADKGSKDVPCNVSLFLNIRDGKLCMQVNNRSNDALFGAYGANAVHMSIFQEYIASAIGVPVGWYAQNSFNMHLYLDVYRKMKERPAAGSPGISLVPLNAAVRGTRCNNPYEAAINTFPLVSTPLDSWDQDLQNFLSGAEASTISDPFFHKVAIPLRDAHLSYREGRYIDAREHLERCDALDWRTAAYEWLGRRQADVIRAANRA